MLPGCPRFGIDTQMVVVKVVNVQWIRPPSKAAPPAEGGDKLDSEGDCDGVVMVQRVSQPLPLAEGYGTSGGQTVKS
ncbi:hypothetical protein Tco_1154876 [Tanacetum coccineum]